MSKHFFQQYVSEKTGKTVQNNLPSYCGKTPAIPFEPMKIEEGYWCKDCYSNFEKLALGSIGKVISKMSEQHNV